MIIQVNQQPFDLSINAVIMGIVNITPDSFSDGGQYLEPNKAIDHGLKLIEDGAHWLDLGAESSRPGSNPVSASEESDRLLPVVEGILKSNPKAILSIDTYKSAVARQSILAGAHIINDISAGSLDPEMMQTVAEFDVPYIMMHMQGTPKTMQEDPTYHHVVADVRSFLYEKSLKASKMGISTILIDPGFGFGKTLSHNYELLHGLDQISDLGLPVVVGFSRKRMFGELIHKQPIDRSYASLAAETIAFLKHVRIFRVHEVAPTQDMLSVLTYYTSVQTHHAVN